MADSPNPYETWVAIRHPEIDAENPEAKAAVVTLAAAQDPDGLTARGWVMVPGSESSDQDRVDTSVQLTKAAVNKAKAAEKES